ncbi:hypothetical protein ACOME3_007726 [Neoechinorhynchus agilis]
MRSHRAQKSICQLDFVHGNFGLTRVSCGRLWYQESLRIDGQSKTSFPPTVAILNIPMTVMIDDLVSSLSITDCSCFAEVRIVLALPSAAQSIETGKCTIICRLHNERCLKNFVRMYADRCIMRLNNYKTRIVRVKAVNFSSTDEPPQPCIQSILPVINEHSHCAFCLESAINRDECSVKEVDDTDVPVAVLCNHIFHARCLKNCRNVQCPVCRHGMLGPITPPGQSNHQRCRLCNSKDGLLMCLFCGEVNCGRLSGSHGYLHFVESGHCFALEMDDLLSNRFDHRLRDENEGMDSDCSHEQRVWDFVKVKSGNKCAGGLLNKIRGWD